MILCAVLPLLCRVYSGYLVMVYLVLFVKPDEFELKPGLISNAARV